MLLYQQSCKKSGLTIVDQDSIKTLLAQLSGWQVCDGKLNKMFTFRNYYETIAFVNASAWISHQENHHPDMVVTYNRCEISYSTHAVNGLTNNDFICAAKLDQLLEHA